MSRISRAMALWAVVGASLGGCASTGGAPGGSAGSSQDLPILWRKSGTYSPLTRRARIVARDWGTLAKVPIAEVPVDFESQMVLIAGLGPTPANDVGVRIARVWIEGSQIRVAERQLHPGTPEETGLQPASPWTIVVVPKSALNVEGYTSRVPDGLLGNHPGSR